MAPFDTKSFRRTRIAPNALPDNAVLVDQTRERTSWFEGMFVTSNHFNREQSYAIARQADLGQAIGSGVVEGLEVTQVAGDPTALTVAPGLGIGAGGESIVLHAPVRIALADVTLQKSLTQSAGLKDSLQLITESRSGLFVLCATPVEYTSNPVGSYATTTSGQRKLRDSVINEATLFTLVPFNLSSSTGSAAQKRAVAARRVFFDQSFADIPPSSLPLAMLELEGNVLQWLDMHLARRQAGASRSDNLGLGFVKAANRAAHFAQYEAMIDEMVTGAPGQAFAAADRFDVLPPMGRLPAAAIAARAPAPGQPAVLSQAWLPSEMPVELAALLDHEIEQLLAESLTLPPIDLRATPETLAQTPVTIIIPVPHANWPDAPLEIVQSALTLNAAKPLGSVPKTAGELISALLDQDTSPDIVEPTDDSAWRSLLAGQQTLWFMRRRQFLRTDALAGEAYAFQISGEGDGGTDGGGGDTPTPVPVPDVVTPITEAFDNGIASILASYGLDTAHRAIRSATDRDGIIARAAFNELVLEAARLGSGLMLTDIIQTGLGAGNLTRALVTQITRSYTSEDLARRFVPFEGLVIGGAVDFAFPPFTPDTRPPRITAQFARSINNNTAVSPPRPRDVPNDMRSRVKDLLSNFGTPDDVLEGVLSKGGGQVPLRNARDTDERIAFLKNALETGVPFVAQTRDPGSVETQTRRNLLARTGGVPKLAQKFADSTFDELFDATVRHMQLIDRALTQTPANAIRTATEALSNILEA